MREGKLKVTLLAHSQLSEDFRNMLSDEAINTIVEKNVTDGQVLALTAIRNCYSHLEPTEIANAEAARYFGRAATDGKGGSEADRLFRHITGSGHTSTLEHISFTFSIEDFSRAGMAQLTRHRVGYSFSIKSQRYVRFGSNDKAQGAKFAVPFSVLKKGEEAIKTFEKGMQQAQAMYDALRELGVTAEDARAVLPNAATTSIVMTVNLTSLLTFYRKRRKGNGAQAEIAELAEQLRSAVERVEPWTASYFDAAK